jgi:uncharacterized protein (DUF433 family)
MIVIQLARGYNSVMGKLIDSDPEIMGGTVVFAGTRVPLQTLLDYIEDGETIEDFLDGFPSVKKEQVIEFLRQATKSLIKEAA